MIRASPAAGVLTSCAIGSSMKAMVSAGTDSSIIDMIVSMVSCPCPNTPSSDTSAMSAGNIARTA